MKQDQDTRLARPVAEFTVERRRVAMINGAAALLLAAGGYIYAAYFAQDGAGQFAALFTAAVMYVVMLHETWGIMLRPPRLRVYHDGVEIVGLGFWAWDDMRWGAGDNVLILHLALKGRPRPRGTWRARARTLTYDKTHDMLQVKYEFPFFSAGRAFRPFIEALARHDPRVVMAPPPPPPAVQRERPLLHKILMMPPGAGKKDVAVTLLLLPVAGCVLYIMVRPGFFPSEEWRGIARVMAIACTVPGTVLYYWAYAKKKIVFSKEKVGGAIGRWGMLAFVPFFIAMLVWTVVGMGVPAVYTALLGTEQSRLIAARLPDSYDSDHCVETAEEDFEDGPFSRLCVGKQTYDALPPRFLMRLQGRQSWFGFVVQRYWIRS